MNPNQPVNEEYEQLYNKMAALVETAIEGYLCHDPEVPETLRKAMMYSLRAGGKRLRPVLILLSCKACGGETVVATPAAAAMEMVHTYSLIHDDLPAMDNDDFRRGQPTNHKVFGDGIAILAGDALLTYAFHTLAKHARNDSLARKLILELTYASGAPGMIGGQVEDLLHQNQQGNLDTVNYIHTHKTAMMFYAACRMGALCADASDRMVDTLGEFGLNMGLAFQIIDDILDVTGTAEEMGKKTQKDHEAGKLTFPAVLGLENSRQQAQRYLLQALAALDPLGGNAEPLIYLTRKLEYRTN